MGDERMAGTENAAAEQDLVLLDQLRARVREWPDDVVPLMTLDELRPYLGEQE
jgi:hypothetical protein